MLNHVSVLRGNGEALMDYAERGAVEKTFDSVLADTENGLERPGGDESNELVDGESDLTDAGRLYSTGILIGMLTTIRSFSNESTDFTEEDANEIANIVNRREKEMALRLTPNDGGDDS